MGEEVVVVIFIQHQNTNDTTEQKSSNIFLAFIISTCRNLLTHTHTHTNMFIEKCANVMGKPFVIQLGLTKL